MATIRNSKKKTGATQFEKEDLKPGLVAASRKKPVKAGSILSHTQRGLVEQVQKIAPERFEFKTKAQKLDNIGWWAECNLNLNQMAGVMGLPVSEFLELMEKNPEIEKAYVTGRERGSAMLYRSVYDLALSGSPEGVVLYLRLHQGASRNPQNAPNSPDRAPVRTAPGVFVGFSGDDGAPVIDAEE